jgi:hypothetical protein
MKWVVKQWQGTNCRLDDIDKKVACRPKRDEASQ